MGYDVAVWDGDRPVSNEQAIQIYERRMDVDDARADKPGEPPTPRVDTFLAELLARWPDLDRPGGEGSPWAMSGVRESASGPFCHLCLIDSPFLDQVVEYIARLAHAHGLVCFDPQLEEVIS